MTAIRKHALVSMTDEGVERTGPGQAPSAFRIWRSGENIADDGSVFFTEESAAKLLAEQASRARPYSIDFDHLSLSTNRPAEAGRAAGYHVLAIRKNASGAPELWAENVEWCEDVRSGLEEQPPRWRYFSPAFVVDEDAEITSYVNLALCINPMTHGIPLLASRTLKKENTMTAEEMLSQLDALIEATEDADTKSALVAAREALAAKKDIDDDAGEEVVADAKDGDDDDKEKKKDDDEDKKSSSVTVTTHTASVDPIASLTAKVLELERNAEVAAIDALLTKHAGLPEEFKAHCRTRSLSDAKAMLTVVGSKYHAQRRTTPSQTKSDPGDGMDPRDADYMDRSMGMKSVTPIFAEKLPDGRFQMHNIRPSDLQRLAAQKGKA